jgi:hypothetical protein
MVKLLVQDCNGGMAPDMTSGSMSLLAVDRSISQLIGFNDPVTTTDSSRLIHLDFLRGFMTHCTQAILDPNIKAVMRTGLIRTAFTVCFYFLGFNPALALPSLLPEQYLRPIY